MASFIFAMVMIFWISTACLSKKKMAVIKEKDGPAGVILAVTGLQVSFHPLWGHYSFKDVKSHSRFCLIQKQWYICSVDSR